MEDIVDEHAGIYKLGVDDLLAGNSVLNLFKYSQEECDDFEKGFDVSSVREMLESVSKAMILQEEPDAPTRDYLVNYIHTLASEDLKRFEDMVQTFTDTNPNMLWNMLSKQDRELYKTPDTFYEWLSTLTDDDVDAYIVKAADGSNLHASDVYGTPMGTEVSILDGYITISSSNLQALNRFRDRMLKTNDCSYEHRVKKHEGVEIHSYVFNINDPSE